jgi:thiol-disulfide isomerase/thioredoxin
MVAILLFLFALTTFGQLTEQQRQEMMQQVMQQQRQEMQQKQNEAWQKQIETHQRLATQEHQLSEGNIKVLDYPQSLAELLKKFEGRVVYIDFMASWCRPCIAELIEFKEIQPYFEENDIAKLYITLDNRRDDINRALTIIQNVSLGGYFTSINPMKELDTTSSFSKDIMDLFFTGANGKIAISIPRYVIVNRKGEIVEKNAARPSNPISLKKQLEKYLLSDNEVEK